MSQPSDHTDTDDEMEFELASEESTPLPESDVDVEADANDGEPMASDDEVLVFELAPDTLDEPSYEAEEEAQEEEEGSRTPQPAANTGAAQPERPTITITQQQILQLLSQTGIRGLFHQGGMITRAQARRAPTQHVYLDENDDEDEDEDEYGNDDDEYQDEDENESLGVGRLFHSGRSNSAARRSKYRRNFRGDRYPKIPSEEGKKLMDSGTFGNNNRCDHSACGVPLSQRTMQQRRKLARRMLDRELGISGHRVSQRPELLSALAAQELIPSPKADLIVNMNARCYSGQFSEDGSFFFACGQDFKVRLYDTSNPYDWHYYKTVHYYGGQWTITDASLSPDNRLLAYSSIRSQVSLAQTDRHDHSEPRLVDFSDMGSSRGIGEWGRSHGHFGIWSIRFSGDGSEIVAGTSDHSVYVYDLEAGRSILRIPGHQDHVNAVCYGDKLSPHILYSGSDDTTLRVWDRRSLASMRPAGMFLGHTEGVTYIDSKGDGRYVISNAKDQTCKLWDLRKMISTEDTQDINIGLYTTNFDYRFSPYDVRQHVPHPHDCSVVTFHGHKVLRTLIRCHFSPPGSTDGRYIYSGSHDGKVYIWNLDGTVAGKIDVNAATKNSRPPSDEKYVDRYDYDDGEGQWKTIVRDCSWHPSAPVLAATSWNGWDHRLGTCTVHSWSDGAGQDEIETGGGPVGSVERGEAHANAASLGSAPMGARVTAQLHHDQRFYGDFTAEQQPGQASRLRRRLMLGTRWRMHQPSEDES